MSQGVRYRPTSAHTSRQEKKTKDSTKGYAYDKDESNANQIENKNETLSVGTYWYTRVIYIRFLSFLYVIAFLIALNQNKELIGLNGLLPADMFIHQVRNHFGNDTHNAFLAVPSLLLFVNTSNIDWWLDAISYLGLMLSAIAFYLGSSNVIVMASLWILYHSIVNIGQRWYSFGWESQLLETGFLAIALCPLFKLQQYPKDTPTSLVAIFGNRWLIFRIMIGAGLIKIRGDECWKNLTCMNYHYQTQPVPNPMSYYLHQSPDIVHQLETLGNHFVELIAPFLLFLNRPLRITGGIIQILFQIILIMSGNLSFLNWLTILPSIFCFDDKFLLSILPSVSARKAVLRLQKKTEGSNIKWSKAVRQTYEILIAVLIAVLSIPVVKNLFSQSQVMNTSFDSFRLVNTYGAFGSITKTRREVIIQGTMNSSIALANNSTIWNEYEFKCKPGNIRRRPCLISPYHYRLDWLMWFAAFQNYQYNPWIIHLAAKLLANEKEATSLLQYNPFENGPGPRYIRGQLYTYEFTRIGSQAAKRGEWWKRRKYKDYFPVIDLYSLQDYLKAHGWPLPGQGKQ